VTAVGTQTVLFIDNPMNQRNSLLGRTPNRAMYRATKASHQKLQAVERPVLRGESTRRHGIVGALELHMCVAMNLHARPACQRAGGTSVSESTVKTLERRSRVVPCVRMSASCIARACACQLASSISRNSRRGRKLDFTYFGARFHNSFLAGAYGGHRSTLNEDPSA
jgi:hypothetical protein